MIQSKNKIKLYIYNINNIIVKLQTTVLHIIPPTPDLCTYMHVAMILKWVGGGTSLMPAKKNSKQVHGIIFILQKWIVKEVGGGGDGGDGYCCIVDDGSSCRCDEMKQQIVDTVL